VLPLAGLVAFFLLSLLTVRTLRPKEPRRYFLVYGALLLAVAAWVYIGAWSLSSPQDMLGLAACLLLQLLLCLTMWNTFYSLLWGFSGGLCHDLFNDPEVRQVDRLVRSYEGEGSLDRILARRTPNLVAGGYIDFDNETFRLRPKGRLIAIGTLAAFKVFSLGMGGGIKS
jgi:hypothetical protein